jgi:uncharacterized protein YijF (DUF1287 family)
MMRHSILVLLATPLLMASLLTAGCLEQHPHRAARSAPPAPAPKPLASAPTPVQARIVAGAKAQIGDIYDASYYTLAYPNGDPPAGRGACTDVVVRGLRADGVDLQMLVHHDMTRHWDRYPHKWGLSRPDPNIDHRRVPNLAVFFRTHGKTLPNAVTPQTLWTWQPGDIVCWKLPGGFDHTGLLSDRRDPRGIPLVIHNLGRCEEQDVLTAWPITGHYRYPK